MAHADAPEINPLPAGARKLLLDFLSACYPAGSAQTRLSGAPDAAIAWQVQSALDDFADYEALARFHANDNAPFAAADAANDNAILGGTDAEVEFVRAHGLSALWAAVVEEAA